MKDLVYQKEQEKQDELLCHILDSAPVQRTVLMNRCETYKLHLHTCQNVYWWQLQMLFKFTVN